MTIIEKKLTKKDDIYVKRVGIVKRRSAKGFKFSADALKLLMGKRFSKDEIATSLGRDIEYVNQVLNGEQHFSHEDLLKLEIDTGQPLSENLLKSLRSSGAYKKEGQFNEKFHLASEKFFASIHSFFRTAKDLKKQNH